MPPRLQLAAAEDLDAEIERARERGAALAALQVLVHERVVLRTLPIAPRGLPLRELAAGEGSGGGHASGRYPGGEGRIYGKANGRAGGRRSDNGSRRGEPRLRARVLRWRAAALARLDRRRPA